MTGRHRVVTYTSERGYRGGDAVVSRHDREMVARALAAAAAQERLSADELEGRLDRTHHARTYGELEQLLADLPGTQGPEERTEGEALHVTAALRKARREGRWRVPPRVVASAGLGAVELDFSEAEITDGAVTVDARPNAGDVELIVPEGYEVSIEEAVPGAEPVHDFTTASPRPHAPRVHVLSRPGLGSIFVRHPGQRRGFLGR